MTDKSNLMVAGRRAFCLMMCFLWCAVASAMAQQGSRQREALPKAPTDVTPGSITYEDVEYPYPVSYLPLTLYGQDVRMAYMDVPPAGSPRLDPQSRNGRVVVLFHGMNFGGFYFSGLIDALRKEGFRVVVPDQIGFGRSSKPIIPYNFHDMALNTSKLLEKLGISKAAVLGHSMGGMLAARFAASYPVITERAILYDPIGLTDVRWERAWRSTDDTYQAMISMNHDQAYQAAYATIRRYFPDAWKPEYEQYARILYSRTLSSGWPQMAMVRSMCQQMVYLDPVVHDWPHIKAFTLVIGGEKDGDNFPALARRVAETIPNSRLKVIPGMGHVLHIQVPDIFYREVIEFLNSDMPLNPQESGNLRK